MRKEAKIIVGIDASLTSTGLCVLVAGQHKLFLIKTKPGMFKTELERVRWIGLTIQQRIKSHLTFGEAVTPENIWWGIEDYSLGSRTGKVITRAEAIGFLKQIMFGWTGKGPISVHPMTLKKFICGRGGIGKEHHLSYALEKFKIHFPNDDVCDAYCVARIVRAIVENETDLYEYEKDAIETVKKYNDNPEVLKSLKSV